MLFLTVPASGSVFISMETTLLCLQYSFGSAENEWFQIIFILKQIISLIKMSHALLRLICMGLVFTGSKASSLVNQSPPDIIQSIGQSGPWIQCSHHIQNYNRILWYKQTKDGQLTYLGYLFGKDPYPEVKGKIKLNGTSNTNGAMMVENLQSNDSAEYFCAAYARLCRDRPGKKNSLTSPQSVTNMHAGYITALTVVLLKGCVLTSEVNQTPPDLIKNQNASVMIYCQHNVPSYYVMLWYKQTQGREMTLMAFLNIKSPNYEEPFDGKVKLDGDANKDQNNSINITSLSAQDTAVYYCAASYHSTTHFLSV
ncbi:uncharacterized protein LOC121693602 [Alosa sapidissima]|uniref:uncharacterized protein LOC121693602 n=1 Tax=Alosa sapidissima TaxID=34773 RepID=UPI001C089F5D|nr:uncharacterized protein LOC121693602 [Alosa sapidissima]